MEQLVQIEISLKLVLKITGIDRRLRVLKRTFVMMDTPLQCNL